MKNRRKMGSKKKLPLRVIFIFLALIAIISFNLASPARNSDDFIWVKKDAQSFNDNQSNFADADHLIMVAGHSVIVSGHLQDAGIDEKDWYLLDYQKGRGLPQAIIAHIKEGIRLASFDERSLLIFSGGETRPQTGPINEGSSYFHVADAMDLWGSSSVRGRAMAEEFATDSFQNL